MSPAQRQPHPRLALRALTHWQALLFAQAVRQDCLACPLLYRPLHAPGHAQPAHMEVFPVPTLQAALGTAQRGTRAPLGARRPRRPCARQARTVWLGRAAAHRVRQAPTAARRVWRRHPARRCVPRARLARRRACRRPAALGTAVRGTRVLRGRPVPLCRCAPPAATAPRGRGRARCVPQGCTGPCRV